jgi:hypothetical protein
MEASLRLKPPFSLHRYRPEQRAGLSLLSLVALIAQIEFDRRGPRVVAQLSRPPSRPFRLRAGRLGLLARRLNGRMPICVFIAVDLAG